MRYRTKVSVVTGGKEYRPGSVLPEDISAADLDFLKSKGFVTPADISPAADDGYEDDVIFGFQENMPDLYKDQDQVRRMRSKKEVYSYAESIGLDLGKNFEARSLKDLQDEVINFQEEKLTEDADYEAEEDEVL